MLPKSRDADSGKARRRAMRWHWTGQLGHGTLGDGLDLHRAADVQQDAGEISQGTARTGYEAKSWGHEMIRSAMRRARAHSHAVISRGDGRALIWLDLRGH